jgi:putative nucleotidyltransferase with HDIG domain
MAIETGRARAVYAADPGKSRGRRWPEPASPTRNAFRRDCDRIIHSSAFRRLAHKTQVFVYHEGDHYRTRLTHTLEVAQIARSLARALGLDEDLAEALALAHDLGHPPFGHAGERALDEALSRFGGFDHNAQGLRIVTDLERRYAAFDGLNLTWETLEGLVKHNGPLTDRAGQAVARYRERGVPAAILAYTKIQDLELWSQPSVEAQIAALSDDIAYDAHDIDDGLRGPIHARRHRRGGNRWRHRARDRRGISRPRAGAPCARSGAPSDHPHDRGRHRRDRPARGGAQALGGRNSQGRESADCIFAGHARSRRRHQRFSISAHVPARARDAGDG